jgi:hypothetical protein
MSKWTDEDFKCGPSCKAFAQFFPYPRSDLGPNAASKLYLKKLQGSFISRREIFMKAHNLRLPEKGDWTVVNVKTQCAPLPSNREGVPPSP